jgi:Splicing regulator sde2, C-terminal
MSTNVLVTSFHPFPTVALSLPHDTLLTSIPTLLASRFSSFPAPHDLHISLPSGPAPQSYTTLSDLHAHHVTLRITPSLRGGKGGFGSQLRAAGGRMSSQKTNNNDSCRDLSGRRLSTVKEAKKCEFLLLYCFDRSSDLQLTDWLPTLNQNQNARKLPVRHERQRLRHWNVSWGLRVRRPKEGMGTSQLVLSVVSMIRSIWSKAGKL